MTLAQADVAQLERLARAKFRKMEHGTERDLVAILAQRLQYELREQCSAPHHSATLYGTLPWFTWIAETIATAPIAFRIGRQLAAA